MTDSTSAPPRLAHWLKDFAALGAGETVARLATFAVSAIVARELGTVALGALTVGQAIVWYALVVGDAGLSTDALRRLATGDPRPEALIARTTAAQALVSLVATGLVVAVAFLAPLSRDVMVSVAILAALPLLYALNLGYVLQARGQIARYARARSLGQVCGAIVGAIGVYASHSLAAAAVSIVVGAAAIDVFVLLSVRRVFQTKLLRARYIHDIVPRLREGRGYLLYALSNHFTSSTPVLATAIIGGPIVVGNYSIAHRLMMLAVAPSLLLATVALPRLTRTEAVAGAAGLRLQTQRIALFVVPVVSAGASFLAIFPRELITLLFGDGAAPAAASTALMSIFIPVGFLSLALTTALLAGGRPIAQFGVTLTGALILVLGVLLLTPRLGARGTVTAMITSETIVCLAMLYLLAIGVVFIMKLLAYACTAALVPFLLAVGVQSATSTPGAGMAAWMSGVMAVLLWQLARTLGVHPSLELVVSIIRRHYMTSRDR